MKFKIIENRKMTKNVPQIITEIINCYIMPAELVIGLFSQFVDISSSYWLCWYVAHIEQYAINTLLLIANLLIVALAVEAASTLVNPLWAKKRSSTQTFTAIGIIVGCTLVVLAPLCFGHYVQEIPAHFRNDTQMYTIGEKQSLWIKYGKLAVSSVAELWLLVLVLAVYSFIYYKYRLVVRQSLELRRNPQQSAQVLDARKALWTCFAPVGAYVMSNVLSAAKELMLLLKVVFANESIGAFLTSDIGQVFVSLGNAGLVFNFTLYVLMQYFARRQYRNALSVELRTRAAKVITNYVTMSVTMSRRTLVGIHARKRKILRKMASLGSTGSFGCSVSQDDKHEPVIRSRSHQASAYSPSDRVRFSPLQPRSPERPSKLLTIVGSSGTDEPTFEPTATAFASEPSFDRRSTHRKKPSKCSSAGGLTPVREPSASGAEEWGVEAHETTALLAPTPKVIVVVDAPSSLIADDYSRIGGLELDASDVMFV